MIRHHKLRGIGDAPHFIILCTLPKTNKSPLKIGHLKRTFHLNQPLIFRGELAVSFSETPGIFSETPGFLSETPGRRLILVACGMGL